MEKDMIPQIRFQDYKESWSKYHLKDLGQWKRGQSLSKNDIVENAINLCIHYGELFGYGEIISDVKSKTNLPSVSSSCGNELLFPDSDVTPDGLGRCSAITIKNVILGSGINILSLFDQFYAPYCSLSINKNKKQIIDRVKGTTVKHIHTKDLDELLLYLSSNQNEQYILVAFFENLNSLIELYLEEKKKLLVFKQSCMERMFPCEGETIPQLRFKEFTDGWEIVPLNSIGSKVIEKNAKKEFNEVFTNSAEFGVISQREYFDHDIAKKDNTSNYYIVRQNDFVYNPRISSFAPYGPINRNKTGISGVVSPLYTVFSVKNVNYLFLEYYFKTSLWHSFMKHNGDNGARHDRFSIGSELFFKMPIYLPSLPEQEKIGEFFRHLDDLLATKHQEIEKLQNIKQSLLDKMFV